MLRSIMVKRSWQFPSNLYTASACIIFALTCCIFCLLLIMICWNWVPLSYCPRIMKFMTYVVIVDHAASWHITGFFVLTQTHNHFGVELFWSISLWVLASSYTENHAWYCISNKRCNKPASNIYCEQPWVVD